MSSNIDDQIIRAKERLKRLEEKKMLQDAKKAIAENKNLKEQLKNKEVESLANSRDYQTVMKQVKELFDDLGPNSGNPSVFAYGTEPNGNPSLVVKLEYVRKSLQKIINLQK